MFCEDEKDYMMRMVKEMVRALFSVALGKEYTQVELPKENKYSCSGTTLDEFKAMVDQGKINEAEDLLLEGLDYGKEEELMAAILFYEYVGRKGEEFLKECNYSLEEVVDGLKQAAGRAGYGYLADQI